MTLTPPSLRCTFPVYRPRSPFLCPSAPLPFLCVFKDTIEREAIEREELATLRLPQLKNFSYPHRLNQSLCCIEKKKYFKKNTKKILQY